MSYIDYRWASAQIGGWRSDELEQSIRRTAEGDPPFYGVVMLAMLRADTFNLARLEAAWPHVGAELRARYHAPGAILESDPEPLKHRVAASYGTTVAALTREPEPAAGEHSASRRVDVLEQEAPHLIAPAGDDAIGGEDA